jgi:prepilin-type processing-associated H-X9-DG protein
MTLPRVQFTIRSMMSVVALVAVLTGVVLLLYRSSEEEAHRGTCQSNLRIIASGLLQYATTYGVFPAGTVANDQLPPERRLSWLVFAWGYMQQIFWLLDHSEPWDSGANRITRTRDTDGKISTVGTVYLLVCPAASGALRQHTPGWIWYIGIGGVGTDAPTLPVGHPRAGIFGYDRRTSLSGITDGASNTLLLVETGVGNGPWTAGGPATVRGLDPARQPYIGRGRQFGGLHPGGVMVAMADGSVRLLRETIEPKVFEALSTVAGGESLPAGWDQ